MKFRKIILKSGAKILLGKDAESNDELIKKFKGKGNIIIHTKAAGSPFCVILKNNKNPISMLDIKEAAVYCARYSQDWRDNKSDVKVHWFDGIDVYKKRGMNIGTFGVKFWNLITIKKRDILKLKNKIK